MAYNPTVWETGDVVTSIKLNKAENAIAANSTAIEGLASDVAADFATIAPNFLTTKAYTAGEYVYYNDLLYRFTADHAAGAWVGTDATQVTLGGDVTDLKNDLDQTNDNLEALEQQGYPMASITEAVEAWGDEHQYEIVNNYVTPEMFGAAGDGENDDTAAVRAALKYSIDNGKKLVLAKTYYITASLLTANDYSSTAAINIEGTRPLKNYVYAVDNYGGIKFDNGLNLFDGVTLQGSIYRVTFAPVSRTQTGTVFYNCNLGAFYFGFCSVSNILAFCYNTSIGSVSYIANNRFLTVYYFAKCDSEKIITDSTIAYNYINGGEALNDNNCFEWGYWNGCTVIGNFIDYYRSIYFPKKASSSIFQGPISIGNQYQVFRYLYSFDSYVSSVEFNSDSDCFNWMNPAALAKLNAYTPITYTGHDGNTYDFPPYIACCLSICRINIKNAIIQNNVSNIIFIRQTLTNYQYAVFNVTVAGNANRFSYDNFVSQADAIYNSGTYMNNKVDIPFIKSVQALPTVTGKWIQYYSGEKIIYQNKIYRLVNIYDDSTSTWNPTWVDITAHI